MEGCLRPAFEVEAKALQFWYAIHLAPIPQKDTNQLFLFTKDKMVIPAGMYVALHAVESA